MALTTRKEIHLYVIAMTTICNLSTYKGIPRAIMQALAATLLNHGRDSYELEYLGGGAHEHQGVNSGGRSRILSYFRYSLKGVDLGGGYPGLTHRQVPKVTHKMIIPVSIAYDPSSVG